MNLDELAHLLPEFAGAVLDRDARELRRLLQKHTTRQYFRVAQRLYDTLIRPIAPILFDDAIDVLVVVPGGARRTIPFAALYDSEK